MLCLEGLIARWIFRCPRKTCYCGGVGFSRAIIARFACNGETVHAVAAGGALEALTAIDVRLVVSHGAHQLEVARNRAVETSRGLTATRGRQTVVCELAGVYLNRGVRITCAQAKIARRAGQAEVDRGGSDLLRESSSDACRRIRSANSAPVPGWARSVLRVGFLLREPRLRAAFAEVARGTVGHLAVLRDSLALARLSSLAGQAIFDLGPRRQQVVGAGWAGDLAVVDSDFGSSRCGRRPIDVGGVT